MIPPRLALPVIAGAAVLLVLASLLVGHGELGGELGRTFLELRATRALAAFMSGAALAIGGVALQALFRNPLVDPSILGTTAGASLGGQLAIVAFQLVRAGRARRSWSPRWCCRSAVSPVPCWRSRSCSR